MRSCLLFNIKTNSWYNCSDSWVVCFYQFAWLWHLRLSNHIRINGSVLSVTPDLLFVLSHCIHHIHNLTETSAKCFKMADDGIIITHCHSVTVPGHRTRFFAWRVARGRSWSLSVVKARAANKGDRKWHREVIQRLIWCNVRAWQDNDSLTQRKTLKLWWQSERVCSVWSPWYKA